jgi:hypothetical protein
MSDLTAKFAALETQLADQETAANTDRDLTNTKLQAVFDELDLILVNNAANARAILAAIAQNSPCATCPTPPIVIPPIGTTPLPVNAEACQRSQAFVSFMAQVFTVLDLASAVGIAFSPSLVTDAFNQVIAGIGGSDSPNAISFPEAVQLVGDLVSYIATNLLVGHTLSGLFAPIANDIRDALYSAGDADAARGAYQAIIASSGLGTYEAPVLNDAAYSDAFTYFFDPDSTPDLTGFSGSACTLPSGTCFTFDLVDSVSSPGGSHPQSVIEEFGPFVLFATVSTSDVDQTFTPPCFFDGNPADWTLEILIGHGSMSYRAGDHTSHGTFNNTTVWGVDGVAHVLPSAGNFLIYGDTGGRVRVCSP